jgi:hypothetical protein
MLKILSFLFVIDFVNVTVNVDGKKLYTLQFLKNSYIIKKIHSILPTLRLLINTEYSITTSCVYQSTAFKIIINLVEII